MGLGDLRTVGVDGRFYLYVIRTGKYTISPWLYLLEYMQEWQIGDKILN